jgi:hypothetical protein
VWVRVEKWPNRRTTELTGVYYVAASHQLSMSMRLIDGKDTACAVRMQQSSSPVLRLSPARQSIL